MCYPAAFAKLVRQGAQWQHSGSPLPPHPHQKETRAAKVGIDLSFLKLFQDETLLDIHAVPLL